MIFISNTKSVQKVSEIVKRLKFERPKILRYNKTTLVSRNKPDVIRKGLEIVVIAEAVTKELKPEDPLKILVVDY